MTRRQHGVATSRRSFLRDASLISLAVASAMGTGDLAWAGKPTLNQLKPLDLGVIPHPGSPGAVFLDSPWADYLTFRAIGTKGSLGWAEVGTAVIELKGCTAKRFRYPGGEPKADDACLADTPEGCCAFTVDNSTWLLRFGSQLPARSQNSLRGMRHYVFTFSSNSFECLARGLDVDVWNAPYGEILRHFLGPVA